MTACSPQRSLLTALPRPSADRELYDEIRRQGFAAFPERLENYLRYQRGPRAEVLDYLPVMLDIEGVSRCNFRCGMCQVSQWPGGQRAGDMALADFQALLDSQPGLVEIKLQGMGEPLLAAETYFAMIRYARQRHLWVRSTTNGSLLHHQDNFKKLIDSDICEIQVSVDGASARSFETIRRGGRFDQVCDNCRLLNTYARQVGKMRTRMWVVVQKENFDELEQLPGLAAELGFKRLTLSLDLNGFGQEAWQQRNDSIDMQGRFTVERGRGLVQLGRECGVEVTFWFIDEKFDLGDPQKLCPWPFQRAYIASDLRVVPCCMVGTPEVVDLGDGRELTEVWNSKSYQVFRRQHLEGKLPRICRSCYVQTAGNGD